MSQPNMGRIASAVKHIASTLKIDVDRTKALFRFTPRPEDSAEIFAFALEQILAKYCRIILPLANLKRLKDGKSVKFIDDTIQGLAPRTVIVSVQPNQWRLSVQGKPSIDGRDGFSEVFYNWKKEAGVVDEFGYIDLKRTNALSGVNQGDHLVTVHRATEGEPGISVDGKPIRQRIGKPYKVKWNEHALTKTEIPGEESQYMLSAAKAGIVLGTFLKKDDPSSLASIDIQETVTINGDVDYAVGDQGTVDGKGAECHFSLDIKGNVRGAFSLQSNGFIHVSGEIEGKSVEADEIVANMILGGCKASAKNTLKVNSIINASAHARLLTIMKNASGANLSADEKITFDEGTNCVGLTIFAEKILFRKTNFAGQNHITLGAHLFKRHKEIKKELKTYEREVQRLSQPNKDTALALLTDIARVEAATKKNRGTGGPEIFEIIMVLKETITQAVQTLGMKIDDGLRQRCFLLQKSMNEAQFHESILVKVESLIHRMERYNQNVTELEPVLGNLQETRTLFQEVNTRIRKGLVMNLEYPEFVGKVSELRVCCGTTEQFFTADMFGKGKFEIRYIVPVEEEDIFKGKVYLSELD